MTTADETPPEASQAAPAVGSPVHRPAGRTVPQRAYLTPLKRRIVKALEGRGEVSYWVLAYELWPPATCARAWRHANKGGPHGWAMPLGKALRELQNDGIVYERLRTESHPERTVWLNMENYFAWLEKQP